MEGVNAFEGTPCPICSAPLRVVEEGSATLCRTPEGFPVNDSTYECEGPEQHYFGILCAHAAGKWAAGLHSKKRLSLSPGPPTQF